MISKTSATIETTMASQNTADAQIDVSFRKRICETDDNNPSNKLVIISAYNYETDDLITVHLAPVLQSDMEFIEDMIEVLTIAKEECKHD